MSFITDVERLEQAKQEQFELLQEFSSPVTSDILIDGYADLFRQLLEQGAAGVDVDYGYIDENGLFQQINISGDLPTMEGSPHEVSVSIFDTGVDEPAYGEYTGGSSDIDFTGVTVTPASLLSGVVAVDKNGNKVTGSIQTVNPTRNANVVTVPSGFVSKNTTITIPVASNPTVSGRVVTVYPGYVPEQLTLTVTVPTGTEYYKCTAVDENTHTWSGYKAVFNNGAYSFAGDVTTGLTYGNSLIPAVGGIYSADALVELKQLYDGTDLSLVFYASLSAESDVAETGQALNASGDITYSEVGGIACASFSGSYLSGNIGAAAPQSDSNRTFSCWAKAEYNDYGVYGLFAYGTSSENRCIQWLINSKKIQVSGGYNSRNEGYSNEIEDIAKWHHYLVTHSDGVSYFYVDGTAYGSFEYSRNTSSDQFSLGIAIDYHTGSSMKYIADVRLYNRALSDAEILELAGKFDVSSGGGTGGGGGGDDPDDPDPVDDKCEAAGCNRDDVLAICTNCRGTFCLDHHVLCTKCNQVYCIDCYANTNIHGCNSCSASGCPNPATTPCSYDGCQQAYCADHNVAIQECTSCNYAFCPDHLPLDKHNCSGVQPCYVCEVPTADAKCTKCGQVYCYDHASHSNHQCPDCGESRDGCDKCSSHECEIPTKMCNECGSTAGVMKSCVQCGATYCEDHATSLMELACGCYVCLMGDCATDHESSGCEYWSN